VEDTIAILRGLKERYEVHHKVAITDGDHRGGQAQPPLHHRPSAAGQGHRPDRRSRQPHPHGDRLQAGSAGPPGAPPDPAEGGIPGAEERKDEAAKKRLEKLQEEIERLEREYSDLEEIWNSEKAEVQGSAQIQQKIEQSRQELEAARRKGDLNRMAELQYGVIPDLERSLQMVDQHGKSETSCCAAR
jgi:ATP-dependent Clp protease ATP-binding subunit ClpB